MNHLILKIHLLLKQAKKTLIKGDHLFLKLGMKMKQRMKKILIQIIILIKKAKKKNWQKIQKYIINIKKL